MRYRIRIQPYISPELYRKLRAHSAVRNVTDSAVAEEALSRYLESGAVEEALALRRLSGVDEAIARLQHDVDVLSQTVAMVARYALAAAPPVVSKDDGRKAQRLLTELLAQAAREIDAGVRLSGLLDRARAESVAPRPTDAGSGR